MARSDPWPGILDIKRTAASTRSEMFGDWLRDPWSWPEIDYLSKNPSLIFDRIRLGRTRFERLSVPKINFGTRPAVVQSPVDRMAYHGVVNAVSARVVGDLADFVCGWRLSRAKPRAGALVDNQQEWLKFIAERREAAVAFDSVLASDITNFFGSISLDRIDDLLHRKAGNTLPAEAVGKILADLNGLSDRTGLPQRSTASSILANALLGPIDDILTRYAGGSGGRVFRWMDDIWVFGGGLTKLRRLQLDLQDELRNIGLEINLGKTMIREGEEAPASVERVDLEEAPPTRNLAASGAPYIANHDPKDLDRQFAALIKRPELADRTSIRYVCARIRDFDRNDLIAGLVEIAPRAPQGADHFARLFGRSGDWRNLCDWYVEQSQGPVGLERLPWPIAQLGTMFPAGERVDAIADLFSRYLDRPKNLSIEMFAVAAHRISKWNPADARVLLREIGSTSESPLCRRIAAISLHNLKEDRKRVARILGEHEENRATLGMLEEYRGRLVADSSDFDPASKPSKH